MGAAIFLSYASQTLRVPAEAEAQPEREPGSRGYRLVEFVSFWPWVPGSRCARPGHAKASDAVALAAATLRRPTSAVELRVVAEDALLVEWNAPFRGEIGCNAWTLGHALRERDQSGDLPLEPFHAIGERVAQACDHLEQGEVDIAQASAEHIVAGASLQHPLEIAEIFLRPPLPEFRRIAVRFLALVFVVERRPDRVVGVVNLLDEVRDGELQLMGPQPPRLVLGREAMARTEIEQDVRGLADQEPASLEERRRERRVFLALAVEQRHDRTISALAPNVEVIGARLLEREPDVFAAPLNLGPVIELIAHGECLVHDASSLFLQIRSDSFP